MDNQKIYWLKMLMETNYRKATFFLQNTGHLSKLQMYKDKTPDEIVEDLNEEQVKTTSRNGKLFSDIVTKTVLFFFIF